MTRRLLAALGLAAALAAAAPAPALAQAMTPAQEQAMVWIFREGGRGRELFQAGRFREAEAVYRAILARTERDFPGDGPMRASALHNLAAAIADLGRPREAEPLAREALRLRLAASARVGAPAIASTRMLLGSILADLGRRAEAIDLLRPAVDAFASDPNADQADLIRAAARLAGFLAETGAAAEADAFARELATTVPMLAGRPDLGYEVLTALARIGSLAGRAGEAEALYRRALDLVDGDRADAEIRRAVLYANIGSVLIDQGRAGEAVPLLTRAVDMLARLHPGGHPALASALASLGEATRVAGDRAGAFALKRRALDMRLAFLPAEHPLVAQTFSALGLDLLDDGQLAEARLSFLAALERRRAIGDGIGVIRTSLNLAVAEAALGNRAAADRLSAETLGGAEARLPAGHPVVAAAAVNRAWLLLAAGRPGEALAAARKAAAALKARFAVAEQGGAERIGLPVGERRGIVVLVAAAWDVAASGRRK